MTRVVMVAIPSTDNTMHVDTMAMCMDALVEGLGRDVLLVPQSVGGVPISHTRNQALRMFLETACTDLFFLDADIVATGKEMIDLILRPADFVAGIYPHRSDIHGRPTFPVQWETGRMWEVDGNGLMQVHGVPAGFMRLTRSVVEKMVAAYPEHWYWTHGSLKTPDLFDFELRDHLKYSEDFTFCKRWRDIGGKIWIDPTIKFDHIGPKRFAGTLDSLLVTRSDPEPMAAD